MSILRKDFQEIFRGALADKRPGLTGQSVHEERYGASHANPEATPDQACTLTPRFPETPEEEIEDCSVEDLNKR